MRIARRFTVALATMSVCLAATVSQAGPFERTDTPDVPNAIVVTYDPETGFLSANGNGTLFSSIEIKSPGDMLIPSGLVEGIADGPFDVNSSSKFFKLATGGLPELQIGAIAPMDMSVNDFIAEMLVDGSIKPAGKLVDAPGGGPYLYVVPEPSSLALAFLGLLGLLGLRRNK